MAATQAVTSRHLNRHAVLTMPPCHTQLTSLAQSQNTPLLAPVPSSLPGTENSRLLNALNQLSTKESAVLCEAKTRPGRGGNLGSHTGQACLLKLAWNEYVALSQRRSLVYFQQAYGNPWSLGYTPTLLL